MNWFSFIWYLFKHCVGICSKVNITSFLKDIISKIVTENQNQIFISQKCWSYLFMTMSDDFQWFHTIFMCLIGIWIWIWGVSKKELNHGKFGEFYFLVAPGVVLNSLEKESRGYKFFPTKGTYRKDSGGLKSMWLLRKLY